MEILLDALATPFSYFLEASRRLYWPFILSALVIASIVVSVRQGKFDLNYQLSQLFNRRYWFNQSTAVDVALLFTNSTLRLVLLLPLLGSHLAATIFFGDLLQSNFGDAPPIALPMLLIGIIYTLTFFVCEDLSRFGLHVALHKLPWLWHFHRLHHSATNLTPLTVHRVHPVEMTLYYLRGLIVFGMVSGTFIYLFRGKVHGWEILGVDCLGFLFNMFGSNLRHSPIKISFGILEKWFVSPAQHQIHHSRDIAHRDKNFGTCLAIWDRIYRSWLPTRSVVGRLKFGINTPKKPAGNIHFGPAPLANRPVDNALYR